MEVVSIDPLLFDIGFHILFSVTDVVSILINGRIVSEKLSFFNLTTKYHIKFSTSCLKFQ